MTGAGAPEAEASWGIMGAALAAYRGGDRDAVLQMRTDVGGVEDVPVALFFRSPKEMGGVERWALDHASGRTLDLGAGPGAIAIPLAAKGVAVTAVEVVPEARDALRDGGISDVRAGGLETLAEDERFDTVLVLMNGTGLAGTLERLPSFLEELARLLASGGQLLVDSTDPRDWDDQDDGRYPGDVHMQLGFRGAWGEPFPFVFVDPDTLAEAAASVGLRADFVAAEEDGRYLARLTFPPPGPTS